LGRSGFRGVMLATIFTLKCLNLLYFSFLRILLSDTLFVWGGWVVSFVCVMFVTFPICFFERLYCPRMSSLLRNESIQSTQHTTKDIEITTKQCILNTP
jgi:hypothetical protein